MTDATAKRLAWGCSPCAVCSTWPTSWCRWWRGHRSASGHCSQQMAMAPATIPATSEATFNPAFAPLSVGTLRCRLASSWSPAVRAKARTGTSPGSRHEIRIVEHRRGSAMSMRKLHLRDALRDGDIGTLKKSDSSIK